MNTQSYVSIFEECGLPTGRLVGGSKSLYLDQNPTHEVVFNSNVFTKKHGKIWYGDLDLTIDSDKLAEVSTKLGESLYVLREFDGRFENEDIEFKVVREKAVCKI